jgi:hypothetical protein
VIDQTKKSPQYGNIRAIKEVRVVNPGDRPYHHRQALPALLERLVFFPIVPRSNIETVGDQPSARRRQSGPAPEVRRVEAATS